MFFMDVLYEKSMKADDWLDNTLDCLMFLTVCYAIRCFSHDHLVHVIIMKPFVPTRWGQLMNPMTPFRLVKEIFPVITYFDIITLHMYVFVCVCVYL